MRPHGDRFSGLNIMIRRPGVIGSSTYVQGPVTSNRKRWSLMLAVAVLRKKVRRSHIFQITIDESSSNSRRCGPTDWPVTQAETLELASSSAKPKNTA